MDGRTLHNARPVVRVLVAAGRLREGQDLRYATSPTGQALALGFVVRTASSLALTMGAR